MVSTAWLAQHLADPDIRIFEVCSLNNDKVYREGHIPGAFEVPCFRPVDYPSPSGNSAMRIDRDDVRAHLRDRQRLLLDVRSPEEYSGEHGALEAKGLAPKKFDDVVCYCRLSHRATIAWLALSGLLGLPNIKIYDGSWTEWGSIVGFPIEK